MSTNRKAEAARRNGAKSHGPATPEGKARSCRNAVTHGLNSKLIVLSTEDSAEFEQLKAEYWDYYKPVSHPECDLVNDIVAARWRLNRLLGLETAAMDVVMEDMRDYVDGRTNPVDETGRAYLAFSKLSNNGAVLSQFARYESRLRRTIEKATAELRRLARERAEAEPEIPAVEPPPVPSSEKWQNEPTVAQPSPNQSPGKLIVLSPPSSGALEPEEES